MTRPQEAAYRSELERAIEALEATARRTGRLGNRAVSAASSATSYERIQSHLAEGSRLFLQSSTAWQWARVLREEIAQW